KDTRLCISLAGRPSNIGTRFHNYLYDQLGLDFIYKAFTTTDIVAAIGGVRALGIRGCSVSMPFKQDVMPLVDVVEASARAIDSAMTTRPRLAIARRRSSSTSRRSGWQAAPKPARRRSVRQQSPRRTPFSTLWRYRRRLR